MNKAQFFRTIKTSLLTGLHHIPAIILYTVVFLMVSGIMVVCGRNLMTQESSLGTVKIGYCIEEKSSRNEFALNIVTGMDSFRDSAELIEYDSRDEGIAAVNSGEIACLIFVPSGFVDSLFGESGGSAGMDVIFRDSRTMEDHLVNVLLQSSANILGTAQGAYFALHFTDSTLQIPAETAEGIERALDARNLSYVLTRTEHFEYENFEALSEFSIKQKLISSYILLILFLSVFVIAYIYKGQNPVMRLRMNSSGLGTAGYFTAEMISAAVFIYGIYMICIITAKAAVPELSLKALFLAAPVILAAAFMITLFVYIFRSPVIAGLFTLVFTLIVMYMAGGLIPSEFLPLFLQKASAYNPFTYLIRFLLNIMWR